MYTELLQQAVSLMLYGMGTVFLFLTLLVAGTFLMSLIAGRIAPPPGEENAAGTDTGQQRAAAAAAALHHRRLGRR